MKAIDRLETAQHACATRKEDDPVRFAIDIANLARAARGVFAARNAYLATWLDDGA